ncbi:Low-density receptor [Olea europaea subsp. europaea]|uniref:Low-density receptor n=1 Tax=Olea europaea subsp. europaea TaxID=158383 RepID=A0A8S0SGV8_OLEEU|nr:Low-density receptor [Olea europaea subsp. europaea]
MKVNTKDRATNQVTPLSIEQSVRVEALESMASVTARLAFRLVVVVLMLLTLYYVGRPLYWKISATIHDIRKNKQTVSGGISQILLEAQNSVGWFHDESDPGLHYEKKSATARRFLLGQVL